MRFNSFGADKLKAPLTKEQVHALEGSKLHSPTTVDDDGVWVDVDNYRLKQLDDENFTWEELAVVVKREALAKAKITYARMDKEDLESLGIQSIEKKYDLPKFVEEYYKAKSPHDGARLVKMDHPTEILDDLMDWTSGKAKPNKAFTNKYFTDFIGLKAGTSNIIAELSEIALRQAFAVKWHYFRIRPQELLMAWAKDDVKAPRWADLFLREYLNKEDVASGKYVFGLYGHPPHPDYVAGHGTLAGLMLFHRVLFDLDDDLRYDNLLAQFSIATYRDYATMHFKSASIMGVQLGEDVVIRELPRILRERGMSEDNIKQIEIKMDKESFDWRKEAVL